MKYRPGGKQNMNDDAGKVSERNGVFVDVDVFESLSPRRALSLVFVPHGFRRYFSYNINTR